MKTRAINKLMIAVLAVGFTVSACGQKNNAESQNTTTTTNQNRPIMEDLKEEKVTDNSRKSILARGCDPGASTYATKALPPLMGNPEYVATTSDADFIEKLKSREWSMIYFAPGACRFSAAKRAIPGGNSATEGWTLEQYRALVFELQGDGVQIVETPYESEAIELLKNALAKARETN